MKIPAIKKREPLTVAVGVSTLTKIEFVRNPYPALLKEPTHFWDEIFIANEAYILEETTHPRIRRKLAYDAESHRLYLEYVEAETLHDLVKAGITSKNQARTHRILQSVAETVADMHAGILCDRPIIHNDLKCTNVLIPNAAPQEAVLIDFSHSYFKGSLPPFIVDKQEKRVGTAKYMAPEKWDGDYSHGFKSDVFAFGVMAYYAYTGEYPFEGDPAQIEQQIREATPLSPTGCGFNILRNILAILPLCLEKNPGRRPSMEHIAQCYADSAGLFR